MMPSDLSENLQSIFEYEIDRGNEVERVDRPAGSNCPLAVIFTLPLDIDGYKAIHHLPQNVRVWENRDRHYSLEIGVVCDKTRHALAGPIAKRTAH
jgi:hypothetical protein